MILGLITLGFALWISYKFYKKRERGLLLIAIILYAELMRKWPLYWPQFISFGVVALGLSGMLFYEAHARKERIFFSYGLLALMCAIIFLTSVIPMDHPVVYKVILKVREIANK